MKFYGCYVNYHRGDCYMIINAVI